jgi:hypothetical protein
VVLVEILVVGVFVGLLLVPLGALLTDSKDVVLVVADNRR